MSRKYYTSIDLTQNQLLNAVMHTLAGAPSAPVAGQTYFNSTSKVGYIWNSTAWRPVDAAALTDGSISLTALATNPLARANHTGTQLASTISDLSTTVQAYRLDQFAAPTVTVSFGTQRISNLADPTAAQDAATKNYVDGAVQNAAAGIDSKASVRLLANANITLSGTQTIDSVSAVAGDRVLVTGQTTGSQNGVYVVASGAWTRAVDADQNGEINSGAFWFIEEGTAYGKTQWRCNNTGTITLGTTSISIVQFGAGTSYAADSAGGLQLIGNQFSVLLPAGSGLSKSASGLAVDTAVVTRKFTGTLTHDGSAMSFTITHNLGTKNVSVWLRDSNDAVCEADVVASTVNAVTITFGAPLANGTVFTASVFG